VPIEIAFGEVELSAEDWALSEHQQGIRYPGDGSPFICRLWAVDTLDCASDTVYARRMGPLVRLAVHRWQAGTHGSGSARSGTAEPSDCGLRCAGTRRRRPQPRRGLQFAVDEGAVQRGEADEARDR
jgi:hypothetical protein